MSVKSAAVMSRAAIRTATSRKKMPVPTGMEGKMPLNITKLDAAKRKKHAAIEPDIWKFHLIPTYEWHHRKPRPGPDGARSHEYRLWILIGWGGWLFEFIGAGADRQGGEHDRI